MIASKIGLQADDRQALEQAIDQKVDLQEIERWEEFREIAWTNSKNLQKHLRKPKTKSLKRKIKGVN